MNTFKNVQVQVAVAIFNKEGQLYSQLDSLPSLDMEVPYNAVETARQVLDEIGVEAEIGRGIPFFKTSTNELTIIYRAFPTKGLPTANALYEWKDSSEFHQGDIIKSLATNV